MILLARTMTLGFMPVLGRALVAAPMRAMGGLVMLLARLRMARAGDLMALRGRAIVARGRPRPEIGERRRRRRYGRSGRRLVGRRRSRLLSDRSRAKKREGEPRQNQTNKSHETLPGTHEECQVVRAHASPIVRSPSHIAHVAAQTLS